MDLGGIVILLVIIGLAFYALERIPFPAQPPWLRKAAEIALAIFGIWLLLPHIGINLGH